MRLVAVLAMLLGGLSSSCNRCPDGYFVTPRRQGSLAFTFEASDAPAYQASATVARDSIFDLAYEEPELSGRAERVELDRTLMIEAMLPRACDLQGGCPNCERLLSLRILFRALEPSPGPRVIPLTAGNTEVLLQRQGVIGNVCPVNGPTASSLPPVALAVESGELTVTSLQTSCDSLSQLDCALVTSGTFRLTASATSGERLEVRNGAFAASDERVFMKDRVCD
jgi:hypothetical protein